ncbi:MAG: phospholipase [Dysgonamonadaceae bacterium]|jgi:hypothetical protein|nr:phospholipase [Dysgonamonadaceae bacterium]
MVLKLAIGFIVFLLIVILIEQIRRKITKKELDFIEPNPKEHAHSQESNICCGAHEVCEKDFLKTALNNEIEYYDDEELDAYKRKGSDKYTESEVEEFREILYTMQTDDVKGWLKSLQLREIELPDRLKDEAFMFIKN